jgi:hypothetical protein
MADPDFMLEPLPYYVENRLWFVREASFDHFLHDTRTDRREISLDTVLSDADRLHRQTGKPVVVLWHLPLQEFRVEGRRSLYSDTTLLTPESVRRFRASTRLVARLRPAITDEEYDVYVYPR